MALCFYILLLVVYSNSFSSTEAYYDALDPTSNITITWDIRSWTSDGYVADVSIFNFQQCRNIHSPGWELGWSWAKREIIWDMRGAETSEQGDCSSYKYTLPHSCKRTPSVIDLLPGAPYLQQVANCCKGGVLSPFSLSAFRLSVGQSGTTRRTVRKPANFTFKAPGAVYTCSRALQANASVFLSPNRRRKTQALLTWSIICQFKEQRYPTCCVSLSSFYNPEITKCPTCSCGCNRICANQKMISVVPDTEGSLQCTPHMCPIRVHWHLKINYKEYWRVKLTVTNFDYNRNYTLWNMVVQHPNFDNLTELFSFEHKFLNPYEGINDTLMMWGVNSYNDMLMQSGPKGYIQSEILFRKNPSQFTLAKGWIFPRKIYFDGDRCMMPPPGTFPWLPNSTPKVAVSPFVAVFFMVVVVVIMK